MRDEDGFHDKLVDCMGDNEVVTVVLTEAQYKASVHNMLGEGTILFSQKKEMYFLDWVSIVRTSSRDKKWFGCNIYVIISRGKYFILLRENLTI